MTDIELESAETYISVDEQIAKMAGRTERASADEIALRVSERLARSRPYQDYWRKLGLDPAEMDKRAEDIRVQLHAEHPEFGWRERMRAVHEMWSAISEPLEEARRQKREAKRAANKAERTRKGNSGSSHGRPR